MQVVLFGDAECIHRCRIAMYTASKEMEAQRKQQDNHKVQEKYSYQSIIFTQDWRLSIRVESKKLKNSMNTVVRKTFEALADEVAKMPSDFDGLMDSSNLPVITLDENGNLKRSLFESSSNTDSNSKALICESLSERVRLGDVH